MQREKLIDRAIGVVGLLLALIPAMNLASALAFSRPLLEQTGALWMVSAVLGVAILVLLFLRRPTVTSKSLRTDRLAEELPPLVKHYQDATFFNATAHGQDLSPTIAALSDILSISLVGSSSDATQLLRDLPDSMHHTDRRFFLNGLDAQLSVAIFFTNPESPAALLVVGHPGSLLITLRDRLATTTVGNLLLRQEDDSSPVQFDALGDPNRYLDFLSQQHDRYLKSFKDISAGYVSFYGTDVQDIQSGWLESGAAKSVRTLDLLTDPTLWLTRKRYLTANRRLIERGGQIQRCFLFTRSRLSDPDFAESLARLLTVQQDLGITPGIQFLEDLQPYQKEDFIIYDSFAVLVEEKQANFDYSFAKSTAHFSKERIQEYERVFADVWSGSQVGQPATATLRSFTNDSFLSGSDSKSDAIPGYSDTRREESESGSTTRPTGSTRATIQGLPEQNARLGDSTSDA